MLEKNNKIIKVIPLLAILGVLVYYLFGWNIGSYLNKDITAYDMEALTRMIITQIDEGKKEGMFFVSGITEEQLVNINDYICSMNGNVVQYTILQRGMSGMRVSFTYDISDNYYVYEKYVNNIDIPSSRPQAQKLYESVVDILDKTVSDTMSDYEKELAIHDYIVQSCKYGYTDYSKEYAYRAYGCLVQKMAVCNGYAEAMALLLSCVGIDNDIVTGTGNDELHAWNIVKINGEWYHVDSTWDDPLPDRGSFVGHAYFNVTDAVMDDAHTWNQNDTETCVATADNYFVKNNRVCTYGDMKNIVTYEASRNITGTIELVATDYNPSMYNYQFIFDISGIKYYSYSEEKYDDNYLITIYLNQKE